MAATRAPLLLSLHGLRLPLLLRLLSLGSLLLLAFFPSKSEAQAPAPAPAPAAVLINRTDPVQARALNSIFRQWNLRPGSNTWNVTGDPCSGTAVDDTDFNAPSLNPSLKCVCNGGICRITQLKVYALNVVGRIADEFQNLTTIFDLNLAQNYLTGPLPAFIGNFTGMQWLSVGLNALSGPLPKELGNLSKLISLGMGGNNFTGTIPPELGNLASLEQWYLDSCGLQGEIPRSLAKLGKLKIFWASDNNFTGTVPNVASSWTNITSLRFQGNSFRGPIPSTYANLVKMNDLRIGDIENGSSSLNFVQNMTSLSRLILRNCKISGTIILNFQQFNKLMLLDLSFNNLTGQLPASLFSLTTLTHLFLGNNSLTGSLPAQKSSSLVNIDLSYNQLSGQYPSWVSDSSLRLNLVFNNFVIDDSNSSDMPSGLKCLQRDIPCNRFSPIYSSFGIKCGGDRAITSSDGTLYEVDDKNLTTASYYVVDTQKWGVSTVGWFADAPKPEYRWSVFKQFANTLDSELFQTARLSPSSLRYYGLGLENGNYTVKLQFVETAYPHTLTWNSTGRRLFDIYIQGTLKEKDFDIRGEAGGSNIALVKNYTAPVTENFLEIHLFWAGRGTCCIPTQGYYGSAISAISIAPYDFIPTVRNELSTSKKSKKVGLIVGLAVGIAAFFALFIFIILFWRLRQKLDLVADEDLVGLTLRADTFSYAELKSATDEFNPRNKLGEGGFGPVFKGILSDNRVVAVKQLSAASRQGRRQFVTEIDTISSVQHRNLVKLYGCCFEGDKRLLVYEYLENNSLDQALFGEKNLKLNWPTRFEICLGMARGLAYLHEESSVRIVHRDIKASNILLDSDLVPKISDFGLAKLYDNKQTHMSTRVAGTIGYLAPEYAMRGHLTEKTDVFAFGVVVLEIITGRCNSDASLPPEQIYLLEWAWHLHEDKCELQMVDPALTNFNREEVMRVIGISLLCTQSSPMLRPSMSRVVAMLVGNMEVSDVTTKPAYLTDWQYNDLTASYASSCDAESASPALTGFSAVNISSNANSTPGFCLSPALAERH